jgi:hypothetical protein
LGGIHGSPWSTIALALLSRSSVTADDLPLNFHPVAVAAGKSQTDIAKNSSPNSF